MRIAAILLLVALVPASRAAAPEFPPLPAGVSTVPDGRLPIAELLARYRPLVEAGWQWEIIAQSKPPGTDQALPILALHTVASDEAAWFITGIHGEEPAGPNALAESVADLAELGERMPVVVVPLANPWGYVRNWRYLNLPTWSPEAEAHSVGDASHWLEDPAHPGLARAARPSSDEAEAFTAWVLSRAQTHLPRWSIDLHEDNLIDRGYVYSQGEFGIEDPLAQAAVSVLRDHGIPVQMEGETRFGEPISGGIVGPVEDGSIDELVSAVRLIGPDGEQPGPAADTVLVFETPAAILPLQQRVDAHRALLRNLIERIQP